MTKQARKETSLGLRGANHQRRTNRTENKQLTDHHHCSSNFDQASKPDS
jgi:hypothetical protein